MRKHLSIISRKRPDTSPASGNAYWCLGAGFTNEEFEVDRDLRLDFDRLAIQGKPVFPLPYGIGLRVSPA